MLVAILGCTCIEAALLQSIFHLKDSDTRLSTPLNKKKLYLGPGLYEFYQFGLMIFGYLASRVLTIWLYELSFGYLAL